MTVSTLAVGMLRVEGAGIVSGGGVFQVIWAKSDPFRRLKDHPWPSLGSWVSEASKGLNFFLVVGEGAAQRASYTLFVRAFQRNTARGDGCINIKGVILRNQLTQLWWLAWPKAAG